MQSVYRAIIFLLIVAALLVGGYTLFRPNSIPTSINISDPSTFTHLKATECVFRGSDLVGEVAGVMYISNGNVRSDYHASLQGKSYEYHLIVRPDGYALWSDQGTDVPILVPIVTKDNGKCSPWLKPNAELFVVPAEVEFKRAS